MPLPPFPFLLFDPGGGGGGAGPFLPETFALSSGCDIEFGSPFKPPFAGGGGLFVAPSMTVFFSLDFGGGGGGGGFFGSLLASVTPSYEFHALSLSTLRVFVLEELGSCLAEMATLSMSPRRTEEVVAALASLVPLGH